MKLKYKVKDYENEFLIKHIYGKNYYNNQNNSFTNFSFYIENITSSNITKFDLQVFGLFSSGGPNDYSKIEADIIIKNQDGTKDVKILADILEFGKFIDLKYETVIPLDFKKPFKNAFFSINMNNGNIEENDYKKKILKLQEKRDFFNTYNKMKELENAIAVVGMKHVGSTMVFNMIRIAYKLLEKKINDGNFTEKQEFDIYVTKSHGIDSFNHHILCEDEECNNISAHVKKFVTVVRDIRDSAISGFLRFHFNQSVNKKENLEKEIVKYGLNVFINSMHENILLYEKSLVKDPYVFQYEKYKENKIEEAIKLFEFLEIKSDKEFVAKVVDITENLPQDENLPIDLKDYTMNEKKLDYLLTNDHNTSNGRSQKWKTFFTKEQLNIIMEEPLIRNYLCEMDYEIL
jgi:hypothetical protein